jgi:cytochrome c-type biogenesis protein CcmH/NrfG
VLTPWLVEQVRSGNAILFLGAGAVRGALGPKGEKAVNGQELRDAIADKFLGGKHKDKALTRVADYAKNESSLPAVQGFVRELFFPLQPPPYLRSIPLFKWFAIVTTNYDLLLERAYDASPERLQDLHPILRDGDNFSGVLRDDRALPYLKLHGCISTIADQNLPLILASEEYAKHRQNRERLFRHFSDWARERPVIFVGYDISDPNILQILFDLSDLSVSRPMYAVVDPGLDDIAVRYWGARRFTPIVEKFEAFLRGIDSSIEPETRSLARLLSKEPLSFQRWVSTHNTPSGRLQTYLSSEISHVHSGLASTGASPKLFYSGTPVDWGAVKQNLDVKRRVAEDVLLDTVLTPLENAPVRVSLIRGHAGSGVSVLLRRIAWDAATEFDALVFFLNEGAVLRPDLVGEIAELTRAPILLVVDDALIHAKEIGELVEFARSNRWQLNLVLGARTNEWNVSAGDLESYVNEEYEVRDLTDTEIRLLLGKLNDHDSLGELKGLSEAEQVDRFKEHSDRQLLVALHEATTGKPFEEIVLDEYERVTPPTAKVLYLDICTLHRLGVPVRAGLVSRVSGITFDIFQREFFKPLEHVVFTHLDSASRDHVYRTRHPTIAEFVFGQALPDPIERAAQITRIVRHMDVDYDSDSEAFGKLVRGKTLADLFADKGIVAGIFRAALESGASPSFIDHQRAVFELNHPGGDMRAALAAIRNAAAKREHSDKSIEHTEAVVLRRLAVESPHQLEKERYRTDALNILRRLERHSRTAHAVTEHARLLLDELEETLRGSPDESLRSDDPVGSLSDRALAEQIRVAEQTILLGLQQFPGDQYLLTTDSRLGDLLSDHPRALASLRHAFDANPSRGFVAVRLARTLSRTGNWRAAVEVLEQCIKANPGSKEAHLELAMLLNRENEPAHADRIGFHLKRSFTEGDSNLTAQFWMARHEFLFGNRTIGLDAFQKLRGSRLPLSLKKGLQGLVHDASGSPQRFTGRVKTIHPSYCFVNSTELKADIFIPGRGFGSTDWPSVRVGSQISFQVGFSLRGPEGTVARLLT